MRPQSGTLSGVENETFSRKCTTVLIKAERLVAYLSYVSVKQQCFVSIGGILSDSTRAF